jgi:nitroreductase
MDREALRRLTRAALDQASIAQAPLALVFCAQPERSAQKCGQRGRTLFSVQDATIACAYAQLAATALGLASAWIGAFDESRVSMRWG